MYSDSSYSLALFLLSYTLHSLPTNLFLPDFSTLLNPFTLFHLLHISYLYSLLYFLIPFCSLINTLYFPLIFITYFTPYFLICYFPCLIFFIYHFYTLLYYTIFNYFFINLYFFLFPTSYPTPTISFIPYSALLVRLLITLSSLLSPTLHSTLSINHIY